MMDNQGPQKFIQRKTDYLQISLIENIDVGMKIVLEYNILLLLVKHITLTHF